MNGAPSLARRVLIIAGLSVALPAVMALALGIGRTAGLGPVAVARLLADGCPGPSAAPAEKPGALSAEQRQVAWDVVVHIRLPRVLIAALVGGLLALSGAVFQGLLRNPLASPFTLGISSGGAFAAALCMLFGWTAFGLWSVPLAASVGGACAAFIAYQLARYQGRLGVTALILAGTIVSTFFSALIGLTKALAGDALGAIVFWIMGSLNDPCFGMGHVLLLGGVGLSAGAVVAYHARGMDLLSLDEVIAAQSGVEVGRLRMLCVIGATLMAGAAVAFSGIIGFIGLMVPHLCRPLVGNAHAWLYPASALMGAVLLIVADALARTILPSGELPVGIVTALVGGPFFLLVFRTRLARYQ